MKKRNIAIITLLVNCILGVNLVYANQPNKDEKPEFEELDSDNDGYINFEEFSQIPKVKKAPKFMRSKVFKKFDSDSDGQIGPDEYEAISPPKKKSR